MFIQGKKIRFIGIGGANMSALAVFSHEFGAIVSGSDAKSGEETEKLSALGIPVTIGVDDKKVEDVDCVVYSSAIRNDNPELEKARELHIETLERHEYLAKIAACFSEVVAIGGTHGKTSTTAMLTHILAKSGKKFAAMIGGESVEFSNYVNNTSAKSIAELKNAIFVCEACEYKRNLLALPATTALVTNAECDHPDCYKSQKDVADTFSEFLEKARCKIVSEKYEFLLQENEKRANESHNEKCGNFCVEIFSDDKIERIYADIKNDKAEVFFGSNLVGVIRLKDGGDYNYENSIFALAAAKRLGIDLMFAINALASFKGVKRRFEFVGKIDGASVIFDFAHHPSEIKQALKRASEQGDVLCVFQPHTYSRTKAYLDDFVEVLGDERNGVKTLALMPTYAAREDASMGLDSNDLAIAIFDEFCNRDVYLLKNALSTVDFVKKHAKGHSVVLMLGAGDIYDVKDLLSLENATE